MLGGLPNTETTISGGIPIIWKLGSLIKPHLASYGGKDSCFCNPINGEIASDSQPFCIPIGTLFIAIAFKEGKGKSGFTVEVRFIFTQVSV